jgi:hypothetical protein
MLNYQTGYWLLTFTGQGKRKCFESWYFSISKSLTPWSLFEAVKCTAPLTIKITKVGYFCIKNVIVHHQHNGKYVPWTIIDLNSVGDSIIIISCSGTKAYSRPI